MSSLPANLKYQIGFAIAHGTYMDEEAREAKFEEIVDHIEAYVAEQTKKAFRDGQLDCQKAGDPTNHVHFKEAVAEQNRLAKLSVWREILGEDFDKFFPEDKFNDFIKVPSFFITAALKLNNGGGDE